MDNANQALVPIEHRLLLDYKIMNCVQGEDSKRVQLIYLWRGLTLM